MESTTTIDLQILKSLIKESVREVMTEEWFKFFELMIPYVDDQEQAEIEARFSPADYSDEDFIDVTKWFEDESQVQ
ncbi:MAG: hypothetical protein ACO31I_08060 [Prochlorotrichaceae cyanobacterium]|jgi:hypothetical protein